MLEYIHASAESLVYDRGVNGLGPVGDKQRIHVCIGVASAMAYLHAHKPEPIIHHDLKPGNVLLEPYNDHYRAKVATTSGGPFEFVDERLAALHVA